MPESQRNPLSSTFFLAGIMLVVACLSTAGSIDDEVIFHLADEDGRMFIFDTPKVRQPNQILILGERIHRTDYRLLAFDVKTRVLTVEDVKTGKKHQIKERIHSKSKN